MPADRARSRRRSTTRRLRDRPRRRCSRAATSSAHPHRRYDPLIDEWVLVSAGRTRRPWLGAEEPEHRRTSRPRYDPDCYLCPGNVRANGERNPAYTATFVFTNDFAALRPDTSESTRRGRPAPSPRASGASCRVVCFSPRHDLTLGGMAARGHPARSSTCGPTRRASSARTTAGSRCSRTGAPRWAPPTRIRTARSGRARRCPARAAARGRDPARARSAATGRRLLLDYAAPGVGRAARGRRERRVAGRRPVLGGLAVRDAGHPAAARRRACPTSTTPRGTPWPTS